MPGHLDAGENAPDEVNVVIEIPRGSDVKYEMDEKTGFVFVDRFLYTATHYPFNYGFIPNTRGEDGDPVDALVITEDPVYPMSVIRSRPIGVLLMEDEGGPDAKLVAVPARHIDPTYTDVEHIMQIPEFTRKQIEHFFSHYKEGEPNKFVKVDKWQDQKYAKELIVVAMRRAKKAAKER
ncbi:MAG TPA: inorganic diphosphatase [Nitrososphaerales archaeon]|nr:inorganic diphosphatase [Nitrososphaerales archaeon]